MCGAALEKPTKGGRVTDTRLSNDAASCRRTASNRVAIPQDLFTFIRSHWRPQASGGCESGTNGAVKSGNQGSRAGTPAASSAAGRESTAAAVAEMNGDDAMEVDGSASGMAATHACAFSCLVLMDSLVRWLPSFSCQSVKFKAANICEQVLPLFCLLPAAAAAVGRAVSDLVPTTCRRPT